MYIFTDETLQDSQSPIFEPIYLPPSPNLQDIVYTLTVRVFDVYWSTATVELRVKIGSWLSLALDV